VVEGGGEQLQGRAGQFGQLEGLEIIARHGFLLDESRQRRKNVLMIRHYWGDYKL
jgi:hypothetical protein